MITMKPGNYINEYCGLSSDEKPIDALVPNASLFLEIDTGDLYLFDRENGEWLLWNAGSGGGGGSGDITVRPLSVNENGSYRAPAGRAYSPVNVNVPQTEVSPLSVTTNGTYTAEDGEAYSPVTVNVPQTTLRSLTATENKTYNAPDGVAYSKVTVNVPKEGVDAQALSVTENGTYTAPSGFAYTPVTVNVPQTDVEPLTVRANGTYTPSAGTAYGPVTVNVPTEGGVTEEAERKDVNFIDYDGRVLYSYSAQEFAGLTALPANPSHEGLTAQGWNWTLADAKAYVASSGSLEIGQMYATSDGKTRLYVSVENESRPGVTIQFGTTVADGVSIDWGDGSAEETSSSTSYTAYSHNYSAAGNYVIALTVNSGTMLWTGASGSSGRCMMGSRANTAIYNCNRLKKVEVGSGVSEIGMYWFNGCYCLETVTIPQGVTVINRSAFDGCYRLKAAVLPLGCVTFGQNALANCYSLEGASFPKDASMPAYCFVTCYGLSAASIPTGTTIISYGFNSCYGLKTVAIPEGVSNINTNAFYGCWSLTEVTIPSSVTYIGGGAFGNCYGMKEYHLKAETPPSLSATNAFQNIPADCAIYVPVGSLAAYQSASNWSAYSGKIREETT